MAGFVYWLMRPAEDGPQFVAAQDAPEGQARPITKRIGQQVQRAIQQVSGSRSAEPMPGDIQQADIQVPAGEAVEQAVDEDPYPIPPELQGVNLLAQTKEQAHAKSWGCLECHKDQHDPHFSKALNIGCTDCHGGNADCTTKDQAHELPRFPDAWPTAGNPIRNYTVLNHERPEFIRFMNPGDLRVAHISCGTAGCHPKETLQVKKSMMTHGCMLWGAALYNNGSVPFKWPRYGESYSMHGVPQRLQTVPPPTPEETKYKGVLPYLDPLPRYQNSQPGNTLRIFERGGRFVIETGIPERLNDPGKPREKLGNRGFGTGNRTDPVFVSLNKTRLLDPTLNFMGTNDHAGDYRNSGCTACHVVYANDRSPIHSGPYAKYGNRGYAAPRKDEMVTTIDPTIPRDEPGHPIEHRFTRAIPTSQCMVCHMHPGTTVMNSYLGYMWWDLETDGEHMYPKQQRYPTAEEFVRAQMNDPNDISAKGLWSDPEFLSRIAELNPYLSKTQFADFHGHGWIYQTVFKKNREGHLLDHKGHVIENPTNAQLQMSVLIPQYVKQLYRDRDKKTPETLAKMQADLDKLRDNVPVHMLDIHLEKGMHCVDCHFVQDNHGNTKLYGEVRAAVEIQCVDCHGDAYKNALELGSGQVMTSGPAAEERPNGPTGRNLTAMRTPFGKRRFEVIDGKIIQHSMVERGMSWEVTQVKDTINPDHPDYNALSAISKTVRFDKTSDQMVWGSLPADRDECAHAIGNMSCIACHSSWNPSCYGCHLPQKADKKMPELHNEGDVTLNYTAYNWQTLRDEVYMLARDGIVTGNRINPVRSACAIHVGSYNKNRESIYYQQQTISGDGMSGIAFSTNVPHTVRGKGETKLCSDCHISQQNDNNALVAQLLMHGTNYMNFIGKYAWVAAGNHGLFAVQVTERDEPQAVIGSSMHKMVYPDYYKRHVEHNYELEKFHEHPGNDIGENVFHPFKKPEILNLQHRGEFLYAACGEMGLRIFDIAFTDHKGFSERIVSAPVSPVGQRLYVRTKYATDVAAPTTIAPDPTRKQHPENMEQAVDMLYAFIYVTDKYEGLIVVQVGTLLDGNPLNNFVDRQVTFNPNGILCGATAVEIVGEYAYVCCDAGLVVVSLADPTKPEVSCVVEGIHHPKSVGVQFRYGFVCDEEGLKVLDTTDLGHPKVVSKVEIEEAHNVYVARTYAYVAGGHQGLVIVDVKNPLAPKIDQIYNGDGCINDLHDVKLGITYTTQFAYLADGKNGLRVVELIGTDTPGYRGFSPRPTPRLIASFPLPKDGHALALSEGVDRDRAVDEAGNQMAVLGRVGARPLNLEEQHRLYMRPDGRVWTVIDGLRDYNIRDAKQREWNLLQNLRAFYPAYQTPGTGPVEPGPPVIPPRPEVPAIRPPAPPLPEPAPEPRPEPAPVPKAALPTITPRFK